MDQLPGLDDECFFIAPIGEEGSAVRKRSDAILEYIVGEAAGELGLSAIRADSIGSPGQITIQVLDHVLGARAAVADLSGQNPNVFYELAVRHTARLPVVLICEKGEVLPFDIAQMRTVFFESTDLASANHCRKEIVNHLREAFDGAVDSPIATTIDIRALQAGNKVERGMAELLTAIEQLGKEQRLTSSRLADLQGEVAREALLRSIGAGQLGVPSALGSPALSGGQSLTLNALGALNALAGGEPTHLDPNWLAGLPTSLASPSEVDVGDEVDDEAGPAPKMAAKTRKRTAASKTGAASKKKR